MLRGFGCSLEHCCRNFWNYVRHLGETPHQTLQNLEYFYRRIIRDCEDAADYERELMLGRLLSMYLINMKQHVTLRMPETPLDAAMFIQSFWESKQEQQRRDRFHQRRRAQSFAASNILSEGALAPPPPLAPPPLGMALLSCIVQDMSSYN